MPAKRLKANDIIELSGVYGITILMQAIPISNSLDSALRVSVCST